MGRFLRILAPAALALLLTGLVVGAPTGAATVTPTTVLVSVNSNGVVGNNASSEGMLSASGRFVAFDSLATNLRQARQDTNGRQDVFERDLKTGKTVLVSKTTGGVQTNGDSSVADISANGRYVLFNSDASNLARHDTNHKSDAFRHDVVTGMTIRVGLSLTNHGLRDGSQAVSMSRFGRFVFYTSYGRAYVRDVTKGRSFLVSRRADGTPWADDSNWWNTSRNVDGGHIAASGRFVTMTGNPDNSAPNNIWLRDRVRGTMTRITNEQGLNLVTDVAVTPNGKVLLYEFDDEQANYASKGLLRALPGGPAQIVTLSSSDQPVEGWPLALSDDGHLVLFGSDASGVVPGDTDNSSDVFLRDVIAGTTTRVSVGPSGAQIPTGGVSGVSFYYRRALSGDGRYAAFDTTSALIASDTNLKSDVYLRGPLR